jgi:hypothetical protein
MNEQAWEPVNGELDDEDAVAWQAQPDHPKVPPVKQETRPPASQKPGDERTEH